MDDLVQFLRARLDEDAAWATEASRRGEGAPVPGGAHWQWADGETDEVITPDLRAKGPLDEDVALSLRSRETWPTGSVGELPQFAIHTAEDVPVAVGGHIVRHDPARVLAEVDAKRRILLLHNIPAVVSPKMAAFGLRDGEAPEDDRRCAGCGLYSDDEPITPDVSQCPILRALALPYADHPDYREDWRP